MINFLHYYAAVLDLRNPEQEVYTMLHVKEWTVRYKGLYDQSNKTFSVFFDSQTEEKKKEQYFILMYDGLVNLLEIHKFEDHLKQELELYDTICDESNKVKDWLSKNEMIGADDLITFTVDYLEYSDSPWHIGVPIYPYSRSEILIDRNDFKSILGFLDLFQDLYWTKQLLPESIEKIYQEMKDEMKKWPDLNIGNI